MSLNLSGGTFSRWARRGSLSPVLAMEDGERGRNRTFNLLIKSQLLCQLSYAPGAESKAATRKWQE